MPFAPTLALNNGVAIPQLGMGLWQISNADMPKVVGAALDAGYRLFDTAVVYGNEVSLGQALKHAGVARNEIFVTTKLWNDEQGYERTLRAFDESLQRLGLDYVDLYLIHWPQPAKDRYVETWRALEKIYRAGKARAIGVSNFEPAQLERLLASGSIVPSVNQIELHPRLQQAALCAFDRAHGIVTEFLEPAGARRSRRSSHRSHRAKTRQDAGASHPALAYRARPHRHPAVRPSAAYSREYGDFRLRLGRRGHGKNRKARHQSAHRA